MLTDTISSLRMALHSQSVQTNHCKTVYRYVEHVSYSK